MLQKLRSNVRKNSTLLRRLSSGSRQVTSVHFLSASFGSTQYLACLLLLQAPVDSVGSEDYRTIPAFYPTVHDEVSAYRSQRQSAPEPLTSRPTPFRL